MYIYQQIISKIPWQKQKIKNGKQYAKTHISAGLSRFMCFVIYAVVFTFRRKAVTNGEKLTKPPLISAIRCFCIIVFV